MMTIIQHLKFLILSDALEKNWASTFSSNFLFKEHKQKSSGVHKMSCETTNFSLFSDFSWSVL